MPEHDMNTRKEYADLICTLLLCNHFNPGSNKALKNCLKLYRKRATSSPVREICKIVVLTKTITPIDWLNQKVAEIEQDIDLHTFFQFAFTQTHNI